MSCVCHIFFSLYPDHPELHSFPTRRSSDLRTRGRSSELRAEEVALGPCRIFVRHAAARGERRSAVAEARDRKSTRLNSSHLVISYAVFCLKKKKNSQTLIHRLQKTVSHNIR